MLLRDQFLKSEADILNCEPNFSEKSKTPCVYESTDGKNVRGVSMSPAGYYNNTLISLALGGYDLVGDMPACHSDFNKRDKKSCNI